ETGRVWGGAPSPPPNEEDMGHFLALPEPGGPAADEVMMADEPVSILEEVVLETEIYVEEPPKLDFAAAFPPTNEDRQESRLAFVESTPTFEEVAERYEGEAAPSYEEEASASYEAEPAPFVEMPVPEPVKAAEPLPSLDDPTTALERAIAALKAGDLAAFAREARSEER